MSIHLVFVTFNRLDYTRKSLVALLADPSEDFALTIWDNASTDGTAEFVRRDVKDPRIVEVVCSPQNVGQTVAVNTVWGSTAADLVGKVDNDTLVTPGWTRTLAAAHADIPALGVVACWHYFMEDFDATRAAHKIQRFGRHQILRHPWTCGTGLLLKRETFRKCGPMTESATTGYWLRLALAGHVNGFYYPLILQEHMDDPKSSHSMLKDEFTYQAAKAVTFSLKNHGQHTLADRWRWRKRVLDGLLDDPWDAKHHVGWRRMLRRYIRWGKTRLLKRGTSA